MRRQSQRGDSVKRSLEASACAPRLRREEYYVLFFQAAFETERRTKMCLLDKNRGRREWGIRFLLLTLRDPECWQIVNVVVKTPSLTLPIGPVIFQRCKKRWTWCFYAYFRRLMLCLCRFYAFLVCFFRGQKQFLRFLHVWHILFWKFFFLYNRCIQLAALKSITYHPAFYLL